MQNIPLDLSGVLMNPAIQVALEKIIANLPTHTPPTKPPEMKVTMEISEELDTQENEATKEIEEEANDYHKHPEYQHLTIDEVVHEDEEEKSYKGDEEDVGAKYIMETSDQELEEELAQQLKYVREEVEGKPSKEEKESSEKMEEDTGPPTGEHDKSPKHDEEIPLSKEQEEKEKEE